MKMCKIFNNFKNLFILSSLELVLLAASKIFFTNMTGSHCKVTKKKVLTPHFHLLYLVRNVARSFKKIQDN